MRVAYLVPPLRTPNGWRSHALGFLPAIAQHVEPLLIVAEEDEEAAGRLFPDYARLTLPIVQYLFTRTPAYGKLGAALAAIQRWRWPEVDLVHSLEAYPAGLLGHFLARKMGRPHVITAHGTYGILPYKSMPHRLLYRRVLRGAAALCPVSPQTGELVGRYFGDALAGVPVRPILNGNSYYDKVSRAEIERRQPATQPTVLSVGAIKPRKGQLMSLQAFAAVQRRLPAARYWVIGKAENKAYHQRILDLIAAEHLEGVELMGTVSDELLRRCYSEASVFALAPQQVGLRFEGFGLVYLEAGAYGLPAVGTASGGVPSAIRDGETGLVVAPDDVEGLAEALYVLLTDHELARRMGLANRQWAETLSWERNAGQQMEVYQEVVRDSVRAHRYRAA